MLPALVEDVAWCLGIQNESEVGDFQDSKATGPLVRRDDGSWAPAHKVLFRFEEVPKAFRIFREGLLADPEVSVRIGPIVGKVTATSAIILLEVDRACDVNVNVARISNKTADFPGSNALALPGLTPKAGEEEEEWNVELPLAGVKLEDMVFTSVGSMTVCHTMEPRRPCTFLLEGLEPNTGYAVFLSNVCQDDIDQRVARFRTLPEVVNTLRLAVVSGHRPPTGPVGEANPWRRLHALAAEGSEINVVLHVDSIMDAVAAGDEAAKHLVDLQSFTKGACKDLERKARDEMRAAYWEAWGRHEPLRKVLAEVGSHLPIFAPPVDLSAVLPVGTDEDRRALLRLSLDMYGEYQRALWHGVAADGKADVRIDARDDESRRRYAGLLGSEVEETLPAWDHEFWVHAAAPAAPGAGAAEEWHIHRYGCTCVVMMDTTGCFLGKQNEASLLMSVWQQRGLADVLADPLTRVIVLASNIPFVLEEVEGAPPRPPELLPRSWSERPGELKELLIRLFQWKQAQYPAREVVLVSRGPGFGTTGDVCDHHLGLSIPVAIVGPTLGRVCNPSRWKMQSDFANGRYTCLYRNPVDQWNMCTIDIDLGTSQHTPIVEVQMIDTPVPKGATWHDGINARRAK